MLKDIYKIAAFGTVAELKDALEDQGDPNSFSDKSGLTALAKVSKNGQLDKVKALVLNGAIHDQEMSLSAVDLACRHGHLDVVRFFLSPDVPEHAKPSRLQSCLTSASLGGHIETVKFLLDYGLDPSKEDEDGMFAILSAAHRFRRGVVSILSSSAGSDLVREAERILSLESHRMGRTDIED